MQAKREIGRLWDDVTKPPYKLLFNGRLSATRLWRSVEVIRAVDDTLRKEQSKLDGRDRSVAVHGNRLIAHAVFRALPDGVLSDGGADFETVLATVPDLTRSALAHVQTLVDRDYAGNYLASLFKNASRCRDVMSKLPTLRAAAWAS